MDEPDPVIREYAREDFLHINRACDIERLGFFHEWRDPVDLSSRTDFLGDEIVRLISMLFADHFGMDWQASRRILGEHRYILITIDREGESTRNRRSGHIEDMWKSSGMMGTILFQCPSLFDSESVLLVDDRETERMEMDVVFEERMRPDDNGDIPIPELRFDVFFLPRRESADEEIGCDAKSREELHRTCKVLSRKDLGRSENRDLYTLPSFLTLEYRMDGGDEDDDGLPGSDISLEETLHRVSSFHVFENLEEDNLLTTGQLVWQSSDDFFDEISIEWDGD